MVAQHGSLASQFASYPPEERKKFLESLSPYDAERLLWDWKVWGRPDQVPPELGECTTPGCECGGDWRYFMFMAGRGAGKTRAAAEWVRQQIESETYERIIIAGATAADLRDIMVEGPSGIMSVCPPWMEARYLPTKRRIEFANGASILCLSADEPDRFRGQQCQALWVDELAAWRRGQEAWDQMMLGLRLPPKPRAIITTTPRPTRLVRFIASHPKTHISVVSTYANIENLADAFIDEIIQQYEGTRMGRQELYAEILDDNPGALWNRGLIDDYRMPDDAIADPDTFRRIVVAVDPAVSFDSEEGDETGIIVAGVGLDGMGYVLEDLSGRMKPDQWAKTVVNAYHKWDADRVIAEVNQGGDMVEHTIRVMDDMIAYRPVRATKGKLLRAEPVSALYERKLVRHWGVFNKLEDQMCTWEPGLEDSPDRLDALVYALTDLMVTGPKATRLYNLSPDNDLISTSYWSREAW